MISSLQALSVVAFLVSLSASQAADLNPGGTDCVDPSGYSSCYSTSANNLQSCKANCGNTNIAGSDGALDCSVACDRVNSAHTIACWLSSCWNMVSCLSDPSLFHANLTKVYSCEYQQTAINYIILIGLSPTTDTIPYYPPPDGAPGACCTFPLFPCPTFRR